MSDTPIITDALAKPVAKPVAGNTAGPAAKTLVIKPVRWDLILAWSVAAFAFLLALFAWLPWLYPHAALMTPFGRIVSSQQPAITAEPLGNTQADAPADTGRMQVMEDKLAALSTRFDTTPQTAAVDAQVQKDVLDKAAAAIRVESIQAATQAATQTATQVAGEAATTAAREVAKGAAITAVAPLLAVARLDDRLARGAAYQAELATLLPILTDAEKTDLAPLAAGGPDNTALAAQLDAQQRELLATYRESMATGWWEKIRARLSAVISISAPDSVPDAASATYLRLRAQILQDDAAAALATLHMLPQIMQESLQPLADSLAARGKAKAALANVIARLTTLADSKAN